MADGGKTPSEHLAYQLGWVTALLDWERREQAGEAVQTPAPGYKWNALGDLNQHYYHTYGALTLAEQQTMLREKVAVPSLSTASGVPLPSVYSARTLMVLPFSASVRV